MPRVAYLAAGSPAELAGLRAGDFLMRIDGEATAAMGPGEVNRRLWLRDGVPVALDVADGKGVARQVRLIGERR